MFKVLYEKCNGWLIKNWYYRIVNIIIKSSIRMAYSKKIQDYSL